MANEHKKELAQFIATLREASADFTRYAAALEKDGWDVEWQGSSISLRAQGLIYDELFPSDLTIAPAPKFSFLLSYRTRLGRFNADRDVGITYKDRAAANTAMNIRITELRERLDRCGFQVTSAEVYEVFP